MTERQQLQRLDQALLALLDERARLVTRLVTRGARLSAAASRTELLRRYDGALPAAELLEWLALTERLSQRGGGPVVGPEGNR